MTFAVGATMPFPAVMRSGATASRSARIHVRELWLWMNPEALESVRIGLMQAAREETVSLGSFEQYADVEIDD